MPAAKPVIFPKIEAMMHVNNLRPGFLKKEIMPVLLVKMYDMVRVRSKFLIMKYVELRAI